LFIKKYPKRSDKTINPICTENEYLRDAAEDEKSFWWMKINKSVSFLDNLKID
jgi:hypothetical protein